MSDFLPLRDEIMGERYWITGVQIGLLLYMPDSKERKKLLDKVQARQFIGNFPTDADKKRFKKHINTIH